MLGRTQTGTEAAGSWDPGDTGAIPVSTFHVHIWPETRCVSLGGGKQPCAAKTFENYSLEESSCSSKVLACLRSDLTM